ncbi:hypothetical protein [Kribbella shirazensis]|uniref:2'-5' RNA ligase family protein n=1 Tax=Kribbella shirazensis TaxID=1105143 RepID=A0A7X5V7V0_9ACTN|nr:hypothetical protein [Kribbella shirazensis]NIK56250.1 hypothetical protein [Kribbella shirazensis]
MTTKFDHLFAAAVPRIANGTHQRDELPREGGRWPISVVLRPSPDSTLAHTLDALTQEAAELAGPGHWQTGRLGAAHLTVRALEPRRENIPPDDPAVARYLSALQRATARSTWPVGFRVTGLTLTPGSVMACAEPLDAAADAFSDHLTTELGPDAWFEPERRDIWYLNLLHFTTDIADPSPLINWVATHRTTPIGTTLIPTPDLVRSTHHPGPRPHMHPIPVPA